MPIWLWRYTINREPISSGHVDAASAAEALAMTVDEFRLHGILDAGEEVDALGWGAAITVDPVPLAGRPSDG